MAMIWCFMRLFRSRSDLCSQKAPKSLRLATLTAIFFIHQSSHTFYSLNTTGVLSTALIKQGLGGISSQLHSLCFASYLIWRISCFNSLIYMLISLSGSCAHRTDCKLTILSYISLQENIQVLYLFIYYTNHWRSLVVISHGKIPYVNREQNRNIYS